MTNIRESIIEIQSKIDSETEEILFCGGGTSVGFLAQAYQIARELNLKTSGYLTANVFKKAYQFEDLDEVVYALPAHPSIEPT